MTKKPITPPVQPRKEKWERFFKDLLFFNYDAVNGSDYEKEDIMVDFVRSLLASQKQEMVEKIREMKKGRPEIKYRMVSDRVDWLNDGYQLALSDILSALEKEGG